MTQTATANYLDPRTLAAIGSLELRARMVVEGLLSGMHTSPYQGSAVEFAQHRQYTAGDDIRRLDWKVYGRTDKLYLKQYQKETNLDLVVMVDASGSMGYTSGAASERMSERAATAPGIRERSANTAAWTKYDAAATLAAAMSYLALRQQDRAGAVVLTDRVVDASRMSNAHDHWRTIVELLATDAPPVMSGAADKASAAGAAALAVKSTDAAARTTDLGRVFDQVLAKLTQRSLIVLMSDLFDAADTLEEAFARVHHRRHDLILLQVLDPAERTFPFRSPSDFIGLEGEGKLSLDPEGVRQAYLESINAHLERVREMTRKFRFDYALLDTGEALGAPLSQFLARRAAATTKKK